jgi:hypothetical protein
MIFHRNSEVYRYQLIREKLLPAILMRVFFGYSLPLPMIRKIGIISVIFMGKEALQLDRLQKNIVLNS